MEPPIDLLVYSKEDVSGVAPIPLEAAEAEAVAEMGLMKGEDLVERLSGVSPLLLIPAEAAAAVCSAAAAAATEPEADDETVVPPFEATAAAAAAAAAARPVRLLVLLLAFGVDDLGMKDEANGELPPRLRLLLFVPPLFAGIFVISTRSMDGE